MPPLVKVHVRFAGVGYHNRPAVIPAVCSSSKRHHQCIHLRSATQYIHNSCDSSISILPLFHRFPLSLLCISATAAISKISNHVIFQSDAAVSLLPFSADYFFPLSGLFPSYLLSDGSHFCIYLSDVTNYVLVKNSEFPLIICYPYSLP